MNRGLGESHSPSGHFGNEENILSLPGNEPNFLTHITIFCHRLHSLHYLLSSSSLTSLSAVIAFTHITICCYRLHSHHYLLLSPSLTSLFAIIVFTSHIAIWYRRLHSHHSLLSSPSLKPLSAIIACSNVTLCCIIFTYLALNYLH